MSPSTQINHSPMNESKDDGASARHQVTECGCNARREPCEVRSSAHSEHSETVDQGMTGDHARHLDSVKALPEIRMGKIDAARRAIADGTFETPDRLDRAINRMLEDLRSE